MPDPIIIEQEAKAWQVFLRWKIKNQDWRILPYDSVQQYLHFLFSDNPKKNGYGIFIGKKDGQWHISFRGRFECKHSLVNGKRIPNMLLELEEQYERINNLKEKVATPDVIEKCKNDYKLLEKQYVQELEQCEELEQIVEELVAIENCQRLLDLEIGHIEKEKEGPHLKPKRGNLLFLTVIVTWFHWPSFVISLLGASAS